MEDGKDIPASTRRRVTAQTVANAAGVSRSAVSRAFTEGSYLDAEKRKKILEVAEKLGYQPNALAAGLKGGRSHLVAIFVGNMRNPYDTSFVSLLVRELNNLNKWPILIDRAGSNAQHAIEEVLRYPLDALILRGGSMPIDIVRQCARIGVPMISSGRPFDAPGIDNVCCRHEVGTKAAVEFLIDRGRTRFGFIAGPQDFFSSDARRAGICQALDAAGLELCAQTQGEFTVNSGYDAALKLLGETEIDALICANDATAIGALSAVRDLGRRVPDDLSLIGFDDIEMASWPSFNLSTISNPVDQSVDAIISLLERRLEDPSRDSETVFVDPYLVLRNTH